MINQTIWILERNTGDNCHNDIMYLGAFSTVEKAKAVAENDWCAPKHKQWSKVVWDNREYYGLAIDDYQGYTIFEDKVQ